MMSWSEDSWEDVADQLPSSSEFQDKTLIDRHLLGDSVSQNLAASNLKHSQGGIFRLSTNGNRISDTDTANDTPEVSGFVLESHQGENESGTLSVSGFPQDHAIMEGPLLRLDGDKPNYKASIKSGISNQVSVNAKLVSHTPSGSLPSTSSLDTQVSTSLSSSPRTISSSGVVDIKTASHQDLKSDGIKWPLATSSNNSKNNVSQGSRMEKKRAEPHDIRSSQESSSANSGQYSLLNPRSNRRDCTLHEYVKEKVYTSKYLYDNYSARYSGPYDTDYDDKKPDDEADPELANAITCLVCCIMGFCALVGLTVILVHFSKQSDLSTANTTWEEDYEEFMNLVYNGRVASVIRSVSRMDQESMSNNTPPSKLGLCEMDPPILVGDAVKVDVNISVSYSDLIKNHSDVREGGEWKPLDCISRHRVAIIIPYRDRWSHLKVLLHYLIPILKRQQIHFRLFIVEQYGNETFNKGRIMNAAFREALKLFDFQCVTFHDVDLLPEDDRNMYSCTEQPKHMSVGIDKFQYILPYENLVGGVLVFKREQFELVNGYSNMYWGWGAEDDDMSTRILHHRFRIYRPPSNIARYKMVKHDGRKSSDVTVRMKLLRSAARRSKLEGLNNVQYTLLTTHVENLFTHFIVDIGHP